MEAVTIDTAAFRFEVPSKEPECNAARVREVLSGNLCRCTGYIPIVAAVLDARAAYRQKGVT